jgi:hypothetical protein
MSRTLTPSVAPTVPPLERVACLEIALMDLRDCVIRSAKLRATRMGPGPGYWRQFTDPELLPLIDRAERVLDEGKGAGL